MASTVMILIIVPVLYTILGDLGQTSVKVGEETETPNPAKPEPYKPPPQRNKKNLTANGRE